MNLKLPSSVLTVGNFDGLHLGHQQIIERVVTLARTKKVPSVLITFEPHPIKVLKDNSFKRLFPLEVMIEQAFAMGIDYIVLQDFTKEFSSCSAEEFMSKYLLQCLNPCHFVVGYDFAFGSGKQGTFDFIKAFMQDLNCIVEQVPALEFLGRPISTTRLKESLVNNKFDLFEQMLGRPYSITSKVIHGHRRGTQLGFATANLDLTNFSEIELPLPGVYYGYASLKNGSLTKHPVVLNLGVNPTVTDDNVRSLEAHLLDYEGDLYGQDLCIYFSDRIRSEKKFNSLDELKSQISQDIQYAKKRMTKV